MIARLRDLRAYLREAAPDALFSPMESLHEVDLLVNEGDEDVVSEPFLHNAKKLALVKTFSDVLEPHRIIGFDDIRSRLPEVRERIKAYAGCAYLSHELGIVDSYLNLDLEKRYDGTRIGGDLFASTREMLRAKGLISNAPLYYKNACLWAESTRKILVEKVRMCDAASGYDYLGVCDTHWHRGGYSCGVLNEFFELKPGQSREDILMYNGESAVLLDAGVARGYENGQTVRLRACAALYGAQALRGGRLSWVLKEENGDAALRGSVAVDFAPGGHTSDIGEIAFRMPEAPRAAAYTLRVRLEGGAYDLENAYRFWGFPCAPARGETVREYDFLNMDVRRAIAAGETALVFASPSRNCPWA